MQFVSSLHPLVTLTLNQQVTVTNFAAMKTKAISILLFLTVANNLYSQIVTPPEGASHDTDSVSTAIKLGEVVVKSRYPDALVSSDNISYSPAATLSGSSGTVYDAVTSLPGIVIDSSGSISVNGMKGISVLIDGRRSLLTGEILMNYLKSLDASRVERIEILSAPSAKNEASSTPITLNLRLKRPREQGFTVGINGSSRLGNARRMQEGLSGTYSSRRMSVSLAYNFIAARPTSRLFTDRPYLSNGTRLFQTYQRRRKDRIHNVTGMFDYIIINRWKLGGSMTANVFHRRERATMDTENTRDHSSVHTDNFTVTSQLNIFGNAYIQHNFSENNDNISLGFDWLNYHNDETQFMADSSNGLLDGDMGGAIRGLVTTLDFKRTLSDCIVLSTGLKSTVIHIQNNGKYTGVLSDDSTTGSSLSSDFRNKEYVNSVYAECQFSQSILTLNAGIRAEHTHIRSNFSGNEISGKADYRRDDLEFFPSVTVKIRAGDSGSALFSYTRGITRPRYADLNPFIYIFDDITHVGGNINLHASVSNILQLAYSHRSWLRVALSTTLGKGTIVKCYRELTDKVLYVSPENIARSLGGALTVSAVNLQIIPSWHLTFNTTLRYDNYRFGPSLGIRGNSRLTPLADCQNLFQFSSGWSAELSGRWQGRMAYGQATVGSSGSVYLGVRKSLFSGIANVTLFMQDIFNTNHTRSIIHQSERSGSLSEREYEMMRQVGVSFSVRFNVGKIRHTKPHHNDIIDEIKRIN